MEIERKYLIKDIPFEPDSYNKKEIIQCYLNPVQKGIERRVRKKGEKFYYTEKSFGDLIREEKEHEISKEEFENLLSEKINNPIYKTRYIIPFNNYTIELDIYQKQLSGLITADVEFNSLEESNQFNPPHWFGKEITYEKKYKNFILASLDKYSADY